MSLEKLEACPLCHEKKIQPFLVCKDYTVTGEMFHVEQCGECGMTFTNPRPTKETIGPYYQSADYISHSSKSTTLIDRIYLIIRWFTVRWKFRLIKQFLHNNTLLDIGCGTGHFAVYCQSKQIDVYGVEPSPIARAKAEESKIKVYATLEQLPDVKFSVITLWHVLEHIYSIQETLNKIKDRLADNGIIIIAVPNYESADAKHYKETWAGYDVPRHAWHFSKQSMQLLLEKNGLTLNQKIPMKLDAFYVSLLSEKYKAAGRLTIINALKALTIGFVSNFKGRKSMNYSSIIYQVKR